MSTQHSLAVKPKSAQPKRAYIYTGLLVLLSLSVLCIPGLPSLTSDKSNALSDKTSIWPDSHPEKYADAKSRYMQTLSKIHSAPLDQIILPAKSTKKFVGVDSSPSVKPDSLWSVISALDTITASPHEAISKERQRLLDNAFWTEKTLIQAKPYLKYVVDQVKSRDLPLSLALIPIIESNYNPNAKSQNQAVGIWQLIPHTGESLGLRINAWIDERKSIERSTAAALDYLEHLYEQLGHWPLAIAAYNAGPSRINAKLKEASESASIWDLELPKETRRYVAKFLALKNLVAGKNITNDIKLPYIADEEKFTYIDLQQRVSLHKIAQFTGIDTDDLVMLNSELLRQSTPPDGPHRLAIPLPDADHFLEKIDNVVHASIELFEPIVSYTVEYGDFLGEIAIRYNTTVKSLKQLNGISGSKIKAGQKLLVFSSETSQETSNETPVPPEYKVKKGDTLSKIAQRFGIKRSTLVKTNDIDDANLVRTGKVLVIPAKYNPEQSDDYLSYSVKEGDSLSTIAEKFDVQLSKIKEVNPPIATANTLFVGQTLKIPIRNHSKAISN